nr:PREDICTED: WD repeat-containing protein on Y chromosome-like isoform X5 [Latimeria chalumnae]|eukprot:XP_014351744.1 PREDICTED: WD repeat-containing protein on Y chromosome-like isoform X5 [Latimeria chalumnae]
MPLGKRLRPTSAAGKLETYSVTSVLDEIRPATVKVNAPQRRARTSVAGFRSGTVSSAVSGISQGTKENNVQVPEWLKKELLKQQHRRHSIGLSHNVAENENIQHLGDPTKILRSDKLEQQVTLEQLQKLKAAFEALENNGKKSLDVESFKCIVKKCLGLHGTTNEQIRELFMKIDYSANGKIAWDEFCTYLQLEYEEKEESSARSKEVTFALPATIREISHGEPILRICSTSDNTFITVREDGIIYYWSPELKLKRSRMVFEKPTNRKPKWVTDFTFMTQYNKFILGTGDREIQLYELSTVEPYCQISGFETIPLKLDYSYTGPDQCMILYGDDQGCVNILILTSVGETLRTWKKLPKAENLPTIGIESAVLSPKVMFIRWKVHEDWVTQLKYYDSIRAVISASNHESTALVIGCTVGTTNVEQQLKEIKDYGKEGKGKRGHMAVGAQRRMEGDQTIFRIYKGAKTFAFCKTNNLLVTGGMDRLIRMWNPYVPGKPTGMLKGHIAPVLYLHISTEDNRIFSVSNDNTIKVWDIQDQSCLFTANPKASRIRGEITACYYVPDIKALCIATDSIALLPLKLKPQPQPHLIVSHKEPVLRCKYNKEFRHVISCSEGSAVKVWDFETGRQVFEFSGAHGNSAITCITFDDSGRRLVTGGRDGCLKIWNYNNGRCLRTLKKEGNCDEICDCAYVEVNKNKYIMAVGWDRKINIFSDLVDDLHHIQKPLPYWQDDLKHGHKEDILCIAQCAPTFLATSSYDGEIIVWNLVSGHMYCQLQTPPPSNCTDGYAVDMSVTKVVFLKTRALKSESTAPLVSSGPQGSINFWNLLNGGQLFATFVASRINSQISTITVTAEDTFLYIADHAGYIYVYDINNYSTSGPVKDPPKGTFGQLEPWDIFTPTSWKHPTVPYEILIDPQSMPIHPVLKEDISVMAVIKSDQIQQTKEPTETKPELNYNQKFSQLVITDEDIKQELERKIYPQVLGKRLRHEIYKNINKPLDHGGPSAYHTLKYFEIVKAPTVCEKPNLSAAGTDLDIWDYPKDNTGTDL